MSFVVIEPGIATTVQDRGRPGLAALGVPPSGAIDRAIADMLNRLVGNPEDAAVLETAGGVRLRAQRSLVIASDSESAPRHLRAGDEISIAPGGVRQWHYLAVQGGIGTPLVLGSRSHDTLSGIGALAITAGTELGIARRTTDLVPVDVAPLGAPSTTIRASAGPRLDWFEGDALAALTTTSWTVVESNRVGVRLHGARIARRTAIELPSEGLVRGAIQIPPDGDLVMMLADHPTTGGYPVVAVVDDADVAALAQHPAGTTIRLRVERAGGDGAPNDGHC